jgi:AcrR family transcriptional regulator
MADTREALLRAGLELFCEKGLDGPSLNAICERAGFTRGAFYVHFADREELTVAVMARVLERWTDTIITTAGDAGNDLDRTIERFTATVLALPMSDDPFLRDGTINAHLLVAGAQRSATLRARFVSLLEDAVDRLSQTVDAAQLAGTIRTDVPSRQIATLLVSTVIGVLGTIQFGFPGEVLALHAAVQSILRPV